VIRQKWVTTVVAAYRTLVWLKRLQLVAMGEAQFETKHPDVKGVLTDLPAVVDEATAFLATQGLGVPCEVFGNDLLASVPQGGDIYVMKSVLHGLNDEQAVAVLKNCRAAMTASATLLVIEAVLPPHGSPVTSHQHARGPPDGHDGESGAESGRSQGIVRHSGLHPASCHQDGDPRQHLRGITGRAKALVRHAQRWAARPEPTTMHDTDWRGAAKSRHQRGST
jgi:O-methyltransferase domain